MATDYPLRITTDDGITSVTGTADFTDPDDQPTGSTPDVPTGDSADIMIKTGDAADGNAGDITLQAGNGSGSGSQGGSIIFQPGTGADSNGEVDFNDADGVNIEKIENGAWYLTVNGSDRDFYADANGSQVTRTGGKLGFFGATPVVIPTVPVTTPLPQDIIDALLLLGLILQSD